MAEQIAPSTPSPSTDIDTKLRWTRTIDLESNINQPLPRAQGLRALWSEWRPFLRAPAAEFLGTMVLVIFGTGVCCQSTLSGNTDVSLSPKGATRALTLGNLWQSFETGIIGWAAGAALGVWLSVDISGGHINPVVTLACALFRGFPWEKVPIYCLAQLLGAFCGSLLVYANYFSAINIFENGARTVPGTAGLFATYPLPYMSNGSAFFSEFLATAVFIVGVLTITQKRKEPTSGSIVAFGIFILFLGEHACLGMETAYCINPARDLGPRLMTWIFYGEKVWTFRNQYWLWTPIIAPLTGGATGAAVYELLVHHDDGSKKGPASLPTVTMPTLPQLPKNV